MLLCHNHTPVFSTKKHCIMTCLCWSALFLADIATLILCLKHKNTLCSHNSVQWQTSASCFFSRNLQVFLIWRRTYFWSHEPATRQLLVIIAAQSYLMESNMIGTVQDPQPLKQIAVTVCTPLCTVHDGYCTVATPHTKLWADTVITWNLQSLNIILKKNRIKSLKII